MGSPIVSIGFLLCPDESDFVKTSIRYFTVHGQKKELRRERRIYE